VIQVTDSAVRSTYAERVANPQAERQMEPNVGGIDRGLRIVLGIAILSSFFFIDSSHRWWALVGFVPLLTGLVAWCPAYAPIGLRTCKGT
jgi:hypothetical protein